MNKYICQKKCIYRGRIYKEGEVLETKNTDVPNHFKLVEAAETTPDTTTETATKSTKKK